MTVLVEEENVVLRMIVLAEEENAVLHISILQAMDYARKIWNSCY